MKPSFISQYSINEINERHTNNVDKLYRMHAGISSRLVNVLEDMVFLEVTIHPSWKKTYQETAEQFIESWRSHNPELQGYPGWGVSIRMSLKIAGFTISPDRLYSDELDQKLKRINMTDHNPILVHEYRRHPGDPCSPLLHLKDEQGKLDCQYPVRYVTSTTGYYSIDTDAHTVIVNQAIHGNLLVAPPPYKRYIGFSVDRNNCMTRPVNFYPYFAPESFCLRGERIYLLNIEHDWWPHTLLKLYCRFPDNKITVSELGSPGSQGR